MKRTICSLITFFIIFNSAILTGTIQPAQAGPAIEWAKTYGGIYPDGAYSAIQTSDGGYAFAGDTYSYSTNGYDNFWLVKTDGNGNTQWSKAYGGSSSSEARALVQTSDGGYAVAGDAWSDTTGSEDFRLVKTNANGNMQWSKTYGGPDYETAYSVIQTNDGGYALAGSTKSYGVGNWDFWLVKTDTYGNMQWNKTYGGTNADSAESMVQTSDGCYAIAGQSWSYGAGNGDFWLVKTDNNGNLQWSRTYGGTSNDHASSVVQTGDGGYALAGGTNSYGAGNYDFWLVKTDTYGNMQWNKTYGGTNFEWALSVIQTCDTGYALAGHTKSYGSGDSDLWLVKTNSAGNIQWSKTYGGTNFEWATSVIQTGDGGYVAAGFTNSFGAGDRDAWLIKLAPAPLQRMCARVDVYPTTLNFRSKGTWVTGYVQLYKGVNVNSINVSSILLNNTVPVDQTGPVTIGDYDNDGIPDLLVKFERKAVIALVLKNCAFEDNYGTATLTLNGKLKDGTLFQGSATIKVILPKT